MGVRTWYLTHDVMYILMSCKQQHGGVWENTASLKQAKQRAGEHTNRGVTNRSLSSVSGLYHHQHQHHQMIKLPAPSKWPFHCVVFANKNKNHIYGSTTTKNATYKITILLLYVVLSRCRPFVWPSILLIYMSLIYVVQTKRQTLQFINNISSRFRLSVT